MLSIIDYGMGNIRSIQNALNFIGVLSRVIDTTGGALGGMLKKLWDKMPTPAKAVMSLFAMDTYNSYDKMTRSSVAAADQKIRTGVRAIGEADLHRVINGIQANVSSLTDDITRQQGHLRRVNGAFAKIQKSPLFDAEFAYNRVPQRVLSMVKNKRYFPNSKHNAI